MPIDKRIDELPTLANLYDSDKILVSAGDGTFNVLYQALRNSIQSNMVRNSFNPADAGKVLMVGANGRITLQKVGSGEMVAITATKNNKVYSPFAYNADGFSEVKVNVPISGAVDWTADAIDYFIGSNKKSYALTLYEADEYDRYNWLVSADRIGDEAIHTNASVHFDYRNIGSFSWTSEAIDVTDDYNP